MGYMVAEVVPLALAIALSPFPIIPAILLLFTSRARANSLAFIGGWIVGILAATVVFILFASAIELFDEPPTWASWTRLVIGLLLVGMGVRKWLRRSADKDVPGWMRSIDGLNPSGAARLSLLLSVANPKVLLLAAAAGLSIGSSEATATQRIATAVVFTLIAASTVATPLLLRTVAGERVLSPLGKLKTWLEVNNALVMSIVVIVIGLALIAKGLSGL